MTGVPPGIVRTLTMVTEGLTGVIRMRILRGTARCTLSLMTHLAMTIVAMGPKQMSIRHPVVCRASLWELDT